MPSDFYVKRGQAGTEIGGQGRNADESIPNCDGGTPYIHVSKGSDPSNQTLLLHAEAQWNNAVENRWYYVWADDDTIDWDSVRDKGDYHFEEQVVMGPASRLFFPNDGNLKLHVYPAIFVEGKDTPP